MFDANALARPNIRNLKPYSSARSEFAGEAEVFLDANENSFGSPTGAALNRYPDPLQRDLKTALADKYRVRTQNIFVGNGSDEAIDLLIRIFCTPGQDEIIVCPPTYGMYRVAADVNDVAVREVPLTEDFELDTHKILGSMTISSKLVFICSPNNPTGNAFDRELILSIARAVNAIVVVDEAYGDFFEGTSLIDAIEECRNLVVLRTLSKAYGLAAARVGFAFADGPVVSLLNKTKPPYNVNELSQRAALEAAQAHDEVRRIVAEIRNERARLRDVLSEVPLVAKVFASDANFLLVRFNRAADVYRELLRQGIVVRDRTHEIGCEECLRITVGTAGENDRLIAALRDLQGRTATL